MAVDNITPFDVDRLAGELGGSAEEGSFISELNAKFGEVDTALDAIEANTDVPDFWIDGGAPAAAGGDAVLAGTNLLGPSGSEMAFDSIDIAGGGTAVLTITLLKPGDSGFQVAIGAPSGGGAAVAVADGVITITPASGGSTVAEMATAVNANAAATDGIARATVAGSGNFTAAAAAADMTGGTGDYSATGVYVNDVECLPANETGSTPTAKWSATGITVTVPDLTSESPARAADDIVNMYVKVNGVKSAGVSFALA